MLAALEGKSFCIVIPPPNVTGALQLGHALVNVSKSATCRSLTIVALVFCLPIQFDEFP